MAIYDRRMLVPYLQNVCCIEMVCARLSREVATYQQAVNQNYAYVNQKFLPAVKPKREGIGKLWALLLIPTVLFFLFIGQKGSVLRSLIIFGSIGAFAFLFMILKEGSEAAQRDYEREYEEYGKAVRFNKLLEENLPAQKSLLQQNTQKLNELKSKLHKAYILRDNIYDVNIIPSQYRDIYSAYYLYDYFKTGRENDLDKVIQTMLLDEIRRQLQTVVMQNEQILLNQRMQIALQEKNNEMLAANHEQEMRQLMKMEHNQQLQKDYHKMIIENQMVTNFFLAEEHYIREKERLGR